MRRAVAVCVGVAAFVHGYMVSGALENDHFVMLARAHQVLYGDWPVRDFEDPGQPLAYLVSTAAAAVFGPTLLVNVILSLLFLSVTAALTFLLARRASGSTAAALVAAAVAIAISPRMYNTTKIVVPVVAMALAWWYADGPSLRRLLVLAGWSAVAFLIRHDYLAYVALSNVVLLAVVHASVPRQAAHHVAMYVLLTVAFIAPWLAYVQANEGVIDYFSSAGRFLVAEGRRTAGGAPGLPFFALTAVPVCGLVLCWRQRHSAAGAFLASACVLLLSMDAVFLRDVLAARVPDVVAPTAVVAAAMAGRLLARRALDITATVLLAGIVFAVIVPAAVTARATPRALIDRAVRVTTRLEQGSAEIQPDPHLAPLVTYLDRCTAPTDRVLVAGFGPEIPVLAHRPFAAGLPSWIPGYYEDPDDIARALARLTHERVSAVVMLDGTNMFAHSWPDIDRWIRAHGFEEHTTVAFDPRVRVWLPREEISSPLDAKTKLPCRTTG